MRKKTLKFVALFAIAGILLLSMPVAFASDAKAPRFDFKTFVKKPIALFTSLFSFIPIFKSGKYTISSDPDEETQGKVKVTGGLTQSRPSDSD